MLYLEMIPVHIPLHYIKIKSNQHVKEDQLHSLSTLWLTKYSGICLIPPTPPPPKKKGGKNKSKDTS